MVPIERANNSEFSFFCLILDCKLMNDIPANLQQTWSEESAWGINFFDEEEIEALTINSDCDTGAGPSAGSSVAASMLDIERARQGQR